MSYSLAPEMGLYRKVLWGHSGGYEEFRQWIMRCFELSSKPDSGMLVHVGAHTVLAVGNP